MTLAQEIAAALKGILTRQAAEGGDGFAVVDPVTLKAFPPGGTQTVINMRGRERGLAASDLAALREALDAIGYIEIDSWLPREGVNWLSDGVPAGVSFRITKRG